MTEGFIRKYNFKLAREINDHANGLWNSSGRHEFLDGKEYFVVIYWDGEEIWTPVNKHE